VARGVLTPEEFATVTDGRLRRRALQHAFGRGGNELRARQRRFFQVAAELAFRTYHRSRGEPPNPGGLAPEDEYRAELASLRSALTSSQSEARRS
jgi:hypothetical protein